MQGLEPQPQMFDAEGDRAAHMLRQLLPAAVEHLAEASQGAQGPRALTLRFGPGLPVPADVKWFRRAYEAHPRVAVLVSAAQAAYRAVMWMLERLAALPWLGGDGARRAEDAVTPSAAALLAPAPDKPALVISERPRSAFERWTDPAALEKWALTYVRPSCRVPDCVEQILPLPVASHA